MTDKLVRKISRVIEIYVRPCSEPNIVNVVNSDIFLELHLRTPIQSN